MEKQFLSISESHLADKSFESFINKLINYYFSNDKLIIFLNSKNILLKNKLLKLKSLEKKVEIKLNFFIKKNKITNYHNIIGIFIQSIHQFYIKHIGFYPTNDELNFFIETHSAAGKSSKHLLKQISNNPIYFNYSKAFFEMKETKFTIAREIRNHG